MPEEFQGKYPESELVEDLLSQGEEWNYLKFIAAQNAQALSLQQQQNAVTDQRIAANAVMLWMNTMLGKAGVSFPKTVSENVVSETVSRNTANQEDTSKDTMDNMIARVSDVEDLMTRAIADLQSQMTDAMAAMAAVLERIELESQ